MRFFFLEPLSDRDRKLIAYARSEFMTERCGRNWFIRLVVRKQSPGPVAGGNERPTWLLYLIDDKFIFSGKLDHFVVIDDVRGGRPLRFVWTWYRLIRILQHCPNKSIGIDHKYFLEFFLQFFLYGSSPEYLATTESYSPTSLTWRTSPKTPAAA